MWILSCDGDLWSGRQRWLRPGSRHLLGRTHNREPGHRVESIEDKSVSRKHVIIAVSNVTASDSGSLHSRTEITVTDESKMGTLMNGEKVHRETKTLTGAKEYTITLGNYKQGFRLKWQPVTLTLSHFSSKKRDSGIVQTRQLFEGSDVKLVIDYVHEHTTHLVATKRNTVAALQALTQGRWLVSVEFIDRLALAVASAGFDDNHEPIPCALEVDFKTHFPDAMDTPAPSGPNELVKRPTSYLMPNPERAEVFQSYVFVFLSQIQYDTLMPAVTSGGGKALLWNVVQGESKVKDLVDYVKEVAGKKGSRQFKLSQQTEKGGVVVVRLSDKTGQWTVDFLTEVEITLDQRSIEQGEFLDAIMTVDPSSLRRPLEDAESVVGSVPPRSPSPSQLQAKRLEALRARYPPSPPQLNPGTEPQAPISPREPPAEPQPQPESLPKRRNRRAITQSRLKRFDDDDDDDEAEPSQAIELATRSVPTSVQSQQDQKPVSGVTDMDVDASSQIVQVQRNTRKRPAPAELEREEDMFDNMLQGQAAMKRIKLAAAAQHDSRAYVVRPSQEPERQIGIAVTLAKKKTKQHDLMAELQAKREKEEEERRKDEESLRNIMDGVDISELKDLAKIELMELPVRERPNRHAAGSERSERWDPAWNGRKNFKRFRPQGQVRDRLVSKRVIVTLEEVPRKGHGIGEEYWHSVPSQSSRSKSKSQSQPQVTRESQPGPSTDDGDDEVRFRRRLQRSREEDAEDNQTFPVEIAGTARDQDLRAEVLATQTQTTIADSQRKGAGKRPAVSQAGPAAKKTKQTTLSATSSRTKPTIDLDDDDDDGLKFRRKRR